MPRALWGQPELWSVCGAERLEEWVLDVYVEGGPRVAWVNRQHVAAGAGACIQRKDPHNSAVLTGGQP